MFNSSALKEKPKYKNILNANAIMRPAQGHHYII